MRLISTRPGPGAASCANTRPLPTRLTTANSTAIERFIIDLLECHHSDVSQEAQTIRQERDATLRRAHEKVEHPRSEPRVILSDDGGDSLACGAARSPP